MYQTVAQQARLAAFIHDFQALTLLSLLCAVSLLLFRRVSPRRGAVAAE